MNLIQIQENLKDLPTQAIMSYANGQNPQVPPYMALSELNRRKSMEQKAVQPPTTSVKEQLEAAVGHQPPPGQPQMPQMPQGMPQGAPQGQPPGQPPGQPMPQGLPQMPQGQPAGMAHGGLAGLHVNDEMFHYAPGGIVAFAGAGLVEGYNPNASPSSDTGLNALIADSSSDSAPDETLRDSGPHRKTELKTNPLGLKSLTPQIADILSKGLRGELESEAPRNPEVIRQEIMDKYPELAKIVNTIPGSELSELSKQLKLQNQESKDKFKESQGRMGLAGLSQALIAAGESTRGRKGLALGDALGGFGKSYANFTAEDIKRQQDQQALERKQSIEVAKLDAEIATLQQGYANARITGDTAAQVAYENAISARQDKKQALQIGTAEKAGTLGIQQGTLDETISRNQALAKQAEEQLAAQKNNWQAQNDWHLAQIKALKESKPPAEQKLIAQAEKELDNNDFYKDTIKKMETFTTAKSMQSPDYLYLQKVANELRKQAWARHKLPPPPDFVMPSTEGIIPPKEEKGWLSSLLGGSTAKPAPKAVSFSDLPD